MLDSLTPPPPAPSRVELIWPGEGTRWVQEPRKSAPGLDSLLTWAFRSRASRIGFQPGHPVWVRIHGQNHRATRTYLDEGEFSQIVNHLYGADGMARLQGGNDFDTAYAIPLDRSTRLRFRLNATPTRTSRRDGGNIVLRPIPDLPPSLADQLVEQGILDSYRAGEGMVIVAGGTGSGKSTLIAGMTKAKLDDPDGNYDIVEGAAPIEFLLERVRGSSSTMNQTEIPRDIPSFPLFIRGCMRREPTDIIVGECRDSETMGAAIQAAISGHLLTTTVHANNVPLTLQRIASLCPADERDNSISAVAQSLRLVINQRLAPTVDGRRTALREFLIVDNALRSKFPVLCISRHHAKSSQSGWALPSLGWRCVVSAQLRVRDGAIGGRGQIRIRSDNATDPPSPDHPMHIDPWVIVPPTAGHGQGFRDGQINRISR